MGDWMGSSARTVSGSTSSTSRQSAGIPRPIRRPDIQAFIGALQGPGANKGVFITTSRFTDEAREYIDRVQPRVVLIDGTELAELMIDHGVGVSEGRRYELKRLDEDYFTDENGTGQLAG